MRFRFIGISEVVYDHVNGEKTTTHVETRIRLDLSRNLDRKLYLQRDLPTKNGVKPLTQCFIQGLVGNIHSAHEKGWWDSAEHLRYVMNELQRGFATVADVSEGTMNNYMQENQHKAAVPPTENLSFGDAISAMKQGMKVARSGWNGKGMFLYYVPADSYPAVTEIAKATFGETVPYGAYIAMKTAQNNVVPWLASQTDMLAEDWAIVG